MFAHADPPWAAFCMILRERWRDPLPHLALQDDQPPQLPTLQCTGHGELLQTLVSRSPGHLSPPCAAWTLTFRLRELLPPPHFWLHRLHAAQLCTAQCTGQANVAQCCDLVSAGQAFPPCAAFRVTVRVLCWEPVPHDLLHLAQPPQLETWQSTGQACVWHFDVSTRAGQVLPPFCGDTRTARVRFLEPPPQDLVHGLQSAQLLTTQLSVGARVGERVGTFEGARVGT
jgi:hypothetical protein